MDEGIRKNHLLIAASLLSIFLFPAVGAGAERGIKVGIIDTYTGPAAVYGQDALRGFKLALAEINKKGVLGKKLNSPAATIGSRWTSASASPKSWS